MSMTLTWGLGARRRALALLAAFCLLASLITVFSPPALGDGKSPSAECSSTNPAWNGDYWKVEKDDGTLGEVETNVSGAITLAADGSWTNNHDDPVFRVVLKIDDDDDDDDDDEGDDEADQVLSGMWATGEGGTIDLTPNGLDHVTFCSTEAPEESAPTTTTLSPTTTTIPTTTTTIPTTTTTPGPTTTTSPDASTVTTPAVSTTTPASDETTTNASDETTTNAAANPTDAGDSGLAIDVSQANELVEESDGSETDGGEWHGLEGLLPDTDRDTTVAGMMYGGPGEPPAMGQASIESNAAPDAIQNSHAWPTQVDLAILGTLLAAIAVLIDRRRLRRLVGKLRAR